MKQDLFKNREAFAMVVAVVDNVQLFLPLARAGRTIKELLALFLKKLGKRVTRRKICNWRSADGDYLVDYYVQKARRFDEIEGCLIYLQPVYARPREKRVTLKNFELLTVIGEGGYSKVFLVRAEWSGEFFAMKVIFKGKAMAEGKDSVVENQRLVMTRVKSPFVAKLRFCFQTNSFFVFVTDYCPGGELFYLLKASGRFSEETARFYTMETLLGLEALHKEGVLYRDLKPQNILIDSVGHAKITDFGLTKVNFGADDKAFTLLGSSSYMAPEMIKEEGHDFTLDYYCLGVLLYELVFGLPPFYEEDPDILQNRIKNEPFALPEGHRASQALVSFLELILQKEPSTRLGARRGVAEILEHPFMEGLKKEQFLKLEVPPPLRPKLLGLNVDMREVDREEIGYWVQSLGDELEVQRCQEKYPNFYYESATNP